MSWWSTSWLPSIPSIDFSLPSGIQKRFISFTLRRTLGHLLKPGQLDIQQVDSQIGSGYVQIRDVELDNDAINSMLAGLPIELHDGSLGKITARIPWPNPLTSTIGLSLESLHLTFNIVPTVSKTTSSRLAESITSVAETFVHDELNDYDEAALRESIYSDADLSQSLDRVPGGLDPFMPEQGSNRDLDPSGVSIFATLVERLLARFEFDAKDLKITLVHPGHSSITLNVPSIRYHTEIKEEGPTSSASNVQGVARTVQVSGVNITTRNLRPLSPQSLTSPAASLSTYRSSNVESSTTATPTYSPPHSPALSDSSEMDEDTTMMMSQSIIGLPVRPISPASSVASSMYASAISTAPAGNDGSGSPVASIRPFTTTTPPQSPSPSPPTPPPIRVFTKEIEDETILSLGSEPIVVRLVAPPPARTPAPTSPPKSESPDISHTNSKSAGGSEALKLEVSMGVIAVALRANHARSLLEMAELWTSHSPESTAQTSKKDAPSSSSPSIFSRYDASLHMRGIVVIVLPLEDSSNDTKNGLATFYSRPLIPPQLEHGYVRLHLDNISATLSSAPVPSSAPSKAAASPSETSMTGRLSLDDISAFAFLRCTDQDQSPSLYASPILITDPHLGSQYPPTHEHPDLSQANSQHPLPAFDVVDWTDQTRHPHNAKLSNWRTKLPQGQAVSAPSTPMNKVKELASSPPSRSPVATSPLRSGVSAASRNASAIEVVFTVVSAASSSRSSRARGKAPESAVDVDVQLAPLHIFCDASLLLNKANPERLSEPLLFLEELSLRDPPPEAPSSFLDHDWDAEAEGEDADEEEEDTPPATPRAQRGGYAFREQERDRERERQRLERLVLEDLDLELDYRQKVPETGRPSIARVDSWRKKQTKTKKASALKLNITFPVLRVEVRTPPPPKFTVRSGAIVLDIHDLRLTPGDQAPLQSTTSARFAETEDPLLAEAFSSPRSSDTSTLLSASWQRLIFACQSSGASKAQMILSLGPLPLEVQSRSREDGIATGSPISRAAGIQQARPQFMITKTVTPSVTALQTLFTTVVTVDIPSVHVHLGKKEIDNLQLWADDISQLIERALNPHGSGLATRDEDADLIGSRFFNKTRHSQGSGTDSAASTVTARRASSNEETNVKVAISEVAVTISLPRETGIRPLNLSASDIDLLLELRPEGKEETVITLGVADLSVRDTSEKNAGLLFLGSTTPRNMTSVVQPLLKLRFTSLVVSDSAAKESRIKVTVCGATYTLYPDLAWITDIARFVKAPPGVFESVVPSERTRLSIKVVDSSIRGLCPSYPGAMVLHLGELEFSSVMVGNLPETSFDLNLQAISLLLLDDLSSVDDSLASSNKATTMSRVARSSGGIWKLLGYSLVAELSGLDLSFTKKDGKTPADIGMSIPRGDLRLHLCADTGTAIGGFIGDFSSLFSSAPEVPEPPKPRRQPTVEIAPEQKRKVDLTASIEEDAFQRTIPEVGATPDMVNDDVPTNPDYLDDSFSATAGLRELDDEDLEDFNVDEMHVNITDQTGLISAYGGETIRLLDPKGLQVEENYFETLPPEANDESAQYGDTTFKLRVKDCGVTVFLYGGYDWARTRRIIEEEAKEMRRRLAKIRQLVADGQTPDPTVEETNTLLFNSVYIGLEHNVDELEPGDLIAAIDEELNEDLETASQSSWQSLKPQPTSPKSPEKRLRRSKRGMTRSKGPSIEFRLEGLSAEVDNYRSHKSLASRILVTIRDAEIFDHIKTSTWSKFLTSLHTDSRGNIRETGSNMVRFELRKVYPVPGNPATEARLRAKILPIRLHVDQDALDFMKKFFAFKDPEAAPSAPSDPADEIFFQRAEVFPVDLKLDFKPRRVDYRALREGKTIELMNFFHFDGAEMTLRHITLNGVTGWARLGDLLNDLWTPDVKATQLVEVISGVAPIRSVVNVGSGVADLVLLPIAQYKKDGRVVRGLQKGTTAFVKSTATEAIKLGARLATGTQVILEQAEHVIGGQFDQSVTAEALQLPVGVLGIDDDFAEGVEADDLISRYADQPAGVKDGVKSAYKSLRRNLTSAAQTILAVPMEVYERSGNEGTMRAVVRAVPIAVLRPMIGASEAVSKTLLGLHNTLDPNVRTDNEAKYKQR